eukprot:1191813-Prorocentrum_minimum.AAC.3
MDQSDRYRAPSPSTPPLAVTRPVGQTDNYVPEEEGVSRKRLVNLVAVKNQPKGRCLSSVVSLVSLRSRLKVTNTRSIFKVFFKPEGPRVEGPRGGPGGGPGGDPGSSAFNSARACVENTPSKNVRVFLSGGGRTNQRLGRDSGAPVRGSSEDIALGRAQAQEAQVYSHDGPIGRGAHQLRERRGGARPRVHLHGMDAEARHARDGPRAPPPRAQPPRAHAPRGDVLRGALRGQAPHAPRALRGGGRQHGVERRPHDLPDGGRLVGDPTRLRLRRQPVEVRLAQVRRARPEGARGHRPLVLLRLQARHTTPSASEWLSE